MAKSPWFDRRLIAGEDERNAVREAVSAIVSQYGHDYYMSCSATGEPMAELWKVLGEQGFIGIGLPEDYGGGGAGLAELTVVLEEVGSGGCPELAMVLSPGIVGTVLSLHGTEAQKSRYLRGIAAGQSRFAFALTEPDAGSNSHKISTVARRSENGWVLKGQKYYISGVDHSDHMLLVAKTGEDERTGRGQLTLFIIDDPRAPGIDIQLLPTQLKAPERQFTVYLDGLEVPEDAVVGEVGLGLKPLFDGLNPERVLSAAISLGVANYAIEKAISYANERAVWGVPIGTHQAVQHLIAEAAMEVEGARLMMMRAAERFDQGFAVGDDANMAKYLASRAGMKALDASIQVHGGNGLADEFGLADLWSILRLQQIAPVSSQMVLNYVAQHTLGLPRSY